MPILKLSLKNKFVLIGFADFLLSMAKLKQVWLCSFEKFENSL